MPFHALPQVEGVAEAIGRHLPPLRQQRVRLHVQVVPEQPLRHLGRDHGHLQRRVHGREQVGRLRIHHGGQRAAGHRCVLGPGRQGHACDRGGAEQGTSSEGHGGYPGSWNGERIMRRSTCLQKRCRAADDATSAVIPPCTPARRATPPWPGRNRRAPGQAKRESGRHLPVHLAQLPARSGPRGGAELTSLTSWATKLGKPRQPSLRGAERGFHLPPEPHDRVGFTDGDVRPSDARTFRQVTGQHHILREAER